MSEADRLFEELGYEEIETSGDNLLEYKKQFPGYSKFIRFDLLDRTFTSFYYISNTQSYLNMQELQAINKKVEELRMDIEEQWREKTLKDIQEGKVIVAYAEKDKDGNTIVRLYTEDMLERC